jgi:uncharacterized phosphatase
MNIYFVRHGQTECHANKVINSYDTPLTELGKQQIHEIGKELAKIQFTRFLTSPMLRALQTADILKKYIKLDPGALSMFKERENGEFEGLPGKTWNQVNVTMDSHAPGGESFTDVTQRVKEGLNLFKTLDENNVILVASHGLYMMCLYCHLTNKDAAAFITDNMATNGGILHIELKENSAEILSHPFVKSASIN